MLSQVEGWRRGDDSRKVFVGTRIAQSMPDTARTTRYTGGSAARARYVLHRTTRAHVDYGRRCVRAHAVGAPHICAASLRAFSGQYEHVFFNQHTYITARQSVGCTLAAVDSVIKGLVCGHGVAHPHRSAQAPNAFALSRPPGHHAWRDRACGFCIFNNVAIAAKYIRRHVPSTGPNTDTKVLIFDWDVHAPQGTLYAIQVGVD